MKKLIIFLILAMVNYGLLAQIITSNIDRPFNKKLAHYKAKEYLIDNVFADDNINETVGFNIDPLSSSLSGDLISLVYDCDQKNKRGLLFGFFSNYNYNFKNIPQAKAKELFKKIEKEIEKNKIILRVFWNDYDALWNFTAYRKVKKTILE